MSRKAIIRSNQHYYHLTSRSNNKENFYVERGVVWDVMIRRLRNLQKKHDLKILAFVLMDNHFHLLMMSPEEDIDRMMYWFVKEVTKDLQRLSGRINKVFGGRYKGCLIDHPNYLFNAYKYICRNPLRAGIVGRAEDYVFSTLHHQARGKYSGLNLEEIDLGYKLELKEVLKWINEDFRDDDQVRLRWGLSRTRFKLMKRPNADLIGSMLDTSRTSLLEPFRQVCWNLLESF